MEELRAMVRDAVRCHFNGDSAPAVIRLHIVKDEVIPSFNCLVIFRVTTSLTCSASTVMW